MNGDIKTKSLLIEQPTEMCKKYSLSVIFYYIFHIILDFLKTLFQSRLLLPTKTELGVGLHCNFSIIL